jgi:cytidylate kinase
MTPMQKYNYISISLDGAAGSGKSTTAHAICKKFKYIHVDTGLHYRALSLFFLNKNITPEFGSSVFIFRYRKSHLSTR